MAEGVVKWFSSKKGYGFIESQGGKDVFVHFTQVQAEKGYKTLHGGDRVSFDTEDCPKGVQAKNVVVIKRGSKQD